MEIRDRRSGYACKLEGIHGGLRDRAQQVQHAVRAVAYHPRQSKMVSGLRYRPDRRGRAGKTEAQVAQAERGFVEDKDCLNISNSTFRRSI